jgi:hypothetical protein
VRAATDDRDARDVWMESICEKLEAHPVQQIGKVLVVYREAPKEDKKPVVPAQAGARSPRGSARKRKLDPRLRGDDNKRRDGKSATRTARPRSRTASPLPASGSRRRRPRTSR